MHVYIIIFWNLGWTHLKLIKSMCCKWNVKLLIYFSSQMLSKTGFDGKLYGSIFLSLQWRCFPGECIRFYLNWLVQFKNKSGTEWTIKGRQNKVIVEMIVCVSALTFRSRWTMLFWWRKETPSRICLMSLFTSSSLKASSSRSDTHWLKISPPAALHKTYSR